MVDTMVSCVYIYFLFIYLYTVLGLETFNTLYIYSRGQKLETLPKKSNSPLALMIINLLSEAKNFSMPSLCTCILKQCGCYSA